MRSIWIMNEVNNLYSSIAQRQSIRLLTEGSLVRTQLGEFTWLHGQAVKTSPFHGGNTGSIPVGVIIYSSIAQSVERMTVNHDVVGSSPTWGAEQ